MQCEKKKKQATMKFLKCVLLITLSPPKVLLASASTTGRDLEEAHVKMMKAKKRNKKSKGGSLQKTVGYHQTKTWLSFIEYTGESIRGPSGCITTVLTDHGYPMGVCAKVYDREPSLYYMNFAGISDTNIGLLYSYYTDSECSILADETADTWIGSPVIGAYSFPLTCDPGPAEVGWPPLIKELKDKPAAFSDGALLMTFPTLSDCQGSQIESSFFYQFVPYGRCGSIISNEGQFLSWDTPNPLNKEGFTYITVASCTKEKLVYNVYKDDDKTCEGPVIHQAIFDRVANSCAGKQAIGTLVEGFGNFKCL